MRKARCFVQMLIVDGIESHRLTIALHGHDELEHLSEQLAFNP